MESSVPSTKKAVPAPPILTGVPVDTSKGKVVYPSSGEFPDAPNAPYDWEKEPISISSKPDTSGAELPPATNDGHGSRLARRSYAVTEGSRGRRAMRSIHGRNRF